MVRYNAYILCGDSVTCIFNIPTVDAYIIYSINKCEYIQHNLKMITTDPFSCNLSTLLTCPGCSIYKLYRNANNRFLILTLCLTRYRAPTVAGAVGDTAGGETVSLVV